MNTKTDTAKTKQKGSKIKAKLLQKKYLLGAVILLVLCVFGFNFMSTAPNHIASAATGINHQINFQGKLVNPDGTNVTDGNYSIVFSIYNVSSGGSAIWTETQTVAVSNGIFQVNLGSVTTLPGSIDFNTDNIYLGVKVGSDAEMTPRIQFTAVPQAFNAEKLGGLDKTGFIQNTISQQPSSNFNISGAGVIGTTLTTPVLQSAASTALTITGNAASTWSTTAGALSITGFGGVTLDNGSAGQTLAIGNSAITHTIQIGTGAAVQGVSIGSTNTTSTTIIEGGSTATTSISIGSANTSHVINIGGGITGTQSISIGATGQAADSLILEAGNTGKIQIGNAATDHTIQIGTAAGIETISIGSTNTTSSVTIEGGANAATAIAIGNGATNHVIAIGGGAGVEGITLGSTNGGSTTTIEGGSTVSGIGIGTANTSHFIKIGTSGSATQSIQIGSGGTSTAIQLQGQGIYQFVGSNSVTVQSTTNATTAFQVENNSSSPAFLVDTSTTRDLIANPNFETSTVTNGWTGVNATLGNVAGQGSYEGNHSLAPNVTVAGGGAQATLFSIPLTPNNYNFSFYAKDVSNGGNLGVTITGGSATCTLNATAMTTAGYKRYSCSFTSTSTNITAITITASNTGSFDLDAVQLSVGATLATYNGPGAVQLLGLVDSPATFQALSNSTTAFQIQDAAGTANLLNADTINDRISIGGFGTSTGQLYVSGTVPSGSLGSLSFGSGIRPYGMAVAGRYAYTLDNSNNGLIVVDVSNPASPVSMGSVATGNGPQDLAVAGRYVYVVNNSSNTLQVFDVSNPASPVSVGSVATGTGPTGLAVAGRYAYVVNNTSGTFQVFDVSNPASPVSVGSLTTSGAGPQDVVVAGRYAYVVNFTGGTFQTIDVSNPASPVSVGSVATAFANPDAVAIAGRYAYVSYSAINKFQVFDVSNPASPVAVGTTSSLATGFERIAVNGHYVYLTTANGNLMQIIDVSNPASPVSVGSVATGTGPTGLAVAGRYAYIANFTSGTMTTYDLGGEYAQQFEAGGAEIGQLSVTGDSSFAGNASVRGGLSVAQGIQSAGDVGISNAQTITTANTTLSNSTLNVTRNITNSVAYSSGSSVAPQWDSAAVYDGSGVIGGITSGSTTTVQQAVSPGSHRYLLVYIWQSTLFTTPTSVKFNGVSMTLLKNTASGTSLAVYGLANPSVTPSGKVVVTWQGTNTQVSVFTSAYYNVSSIGTPTSLTGTATGATSPTVNTATNSLVADFFYGGATNGTPRTLGSGQTGIYNSGFDNVGFGYKPVSTATTTTSWTQNASSAYGLIDIPMFGVGNNGVTINTPATTVSSNCTTTTQNNCADSGSLLQLTQSNIDSSGDGLFIQNAGYGNAIQIGDGTTTADQTIQVNTQGTASIQLNGDTGNTAGEQGGAYLSFSQDGGTVSGIIGMSQSGETLPNGAASFEGANFDGTAQNQLIIGTTGNSGVSFVSNSTYVGGYTNVGAWQLESNTATHVLTTMGITNTSTAIGNSSVVIDNALSSTQNSIALNVAGNNEGQLRFNNGGDVFLSSVNSSNSGEIFLAYDGGNAGGIGVVIGHTAGAGTGINLSVRGTATTCTIGSGTGGTSCSSDSRLKKNVVDMGNSLNDILALRPVNFTWIDPNMSQSTQMGFIAQEVQQIFPQSVTMGDNGYYQLDYASLVTPAIGAIQQQQAEINGINQQLTSISGGGSLSNSSVTTGTLNVSGGASLQGNTNVQGNLSVTGATNLSTLITSGDISTTQNLHVANTVSAHDVTIANNLTVGGTTTVKDIVVGGHLITSGSAPILQVLTAAGSQGATAAISGNDTSGTITITTGDASEPGVTGPTLGDLLKLTFSTLYSQAPHVMITANDAASAGLLVYPSGANAAGFNLSVGNSPQPSTTYSFTYYTVQ